MVDTENGNLPIIKPNPDPSDATTRQLHREIAALRDLMTIRFEGMDKAVVLLQETINRTPTVAEVNLSVIDLKILHEEKLRSTQILFDTQFKERDSRSEQTARDSKVAVDAAFAAAKEAVGEQNKSNALSISKSEAATTKQIDQINTIMLANSTNLNDKIDTVVKAISDKIDDLKTRITAVESRMTGFEGRKTGSDDTGRMTVAISGIAITAVISLIGIGISLVNTSHIAANSDRIAVGAQIDKERSRAP